MKWAKFCVTPNVGGIVILVLADDYPSRPSRLVVPFGPDGGADSIARILAKRVSQTIDQMIVIENRAGRLYHRHRGGAKVRSRRLHSAMLLGGFLLFGFVALLVV